MTADKLTITLTNRRPVTISREEWDVTASSADAPGSVHNGTPLPDYEYDTYRLTVRQHADGRTLVYGVLSAATVWTGTESWRGGELLDAGGDIVAAILRVGAVGGLTDACIRECVADLPAEEL